MTHGIALICRYGRGTGKGRSHVYLHPRLTFDTNLGGLCSRTCGRTRVRTRVRALRKRSARAQGGRAHRYGEAFPGGAGSSAQTTGPITLTNCDKPQHPHCHGRRLPGHSGTETHRHPSSRATGRPEPSRPAPGRSESRTGCSVRASGEGLKTQGRAQSSPGRRWRLPRRAQCRSFDSRSALRADCELRMTGVG
jgi:hypothetical protein